MIMMIMKHRPCLLLVASIAIFFSAIAAATAETVSAVESALGMTRQLQGDANCEGLIQEMLTCFFANCLDLECTVTTQLEAAGDCESMTQQVCTRINEPCCLPCDEIASNYLNCVLLSSPIAEACPGISCGSETNSSSSTLTTTNNPTDIDANNDNNSTISFANVTTATGVLVGNGTLPVNKTEIEGRDGSGGIDVDGSTLFNKDSETTHTAKLITERSSTQAESINTSNAWRYNNLQFVSSSVVAIIVGIICAATL